MDYQKKFTMSTTQTPPTKQYKRFSSSYNAQAKKTEMISAVSAAYSNSIPHCSELGSSIDKMVVTKLDYKSAYPSFLNDGKHEPIIFQSKYFALTQNAVYNNSYSNTQKTNGGNDQTQTIFVTRSLEKNDEGLDDLFAFFQQIDKFVLDNKEKILTEFDGKSREYKPLVRPDGKGNEKVWMKLNPNGSEGKYCVFYKNSDAHKYKVNRFKEFTTATLPRVLTRGTRLRIIATMSKVWANLDEFGISVKVMQVEVDDTIVSKLQVLDKLKNNRLNMFEQDTPIVVDETINKEYDRLYNQAVYGMNKRQIQKGNTNVVSSLKNSGMRSFFSDRDYETLTVDM